MVKDRVGISPNQIMYCFGMCQMTTCFEKDKKVADSQTQLLFVEFLEFVGRIAHVKFEGSELEEQLNLAQKIEYILDDILPLAHQKRREPLIEQASSEESESDY